LMMLRLTPPWWRFKVSLLFGVKSKTQQVIFLKKVLQEVRKGLNLSSFQLFSQYPIVQPISNCSANIYYSYTVQCLLFHYLRPNDSGQMTSTVKNVYFSSCYFLHFASTFKLNSIECHIQLQNCDLKGTILTTPVGHCRSSIMIIILSSR
jgi:hypothetical protein